jgi:hypothetical protein
MRIRTLLLATLLVVACAGRGAAQIDSSGDSAIRRPPCGLRTEGGPCIYVISIIELIARPELYHNRRVAVTGYLWLEFEGNAIYLSSDDQRYMITQNGLWVDFAPNVLRPGTRYSGRFVSIVGTFNATSYGHMGLWSGTIENITSAQVER